MTEAQLAELRGEIFGLKIIVVNTLSHIVARATDPIATLDEIQRQSALGIASAAPANIPPAWLELFRNAATACVLQATEVAKLSHEPPPPPVRRQ
jgi:hypothetical protein